MTHPEILERWPHTDQGTNRWRDIGDDVGLDLDTVRAWYYRESIPSDWWPKLLSSAEKRGIKLDVFELLDGQP